MASTFSNLNVRKLSKDTTLTVMVKVTKEFRLRMWIGLKLMALASWVIGCNFKVDKGK